jgi:hypothetical protein
MMRFVVVWYDIATTRNQDSFDLVYIVSLEMVR